MKQEEFLPQLLVEIAMYIKKLFSHLY